MICEGVRWLRAGLVVACCWLMPMVALAQPADKARAQQRLQAGSARYRQGDHQGALDRFKEAQALYPSPKIFFNIGQAYRQLGRPAAAVEAYERFLAEATDAARGPRREAEGWLARLRPKVGFLKVVAGAGATVSVDGQPSGVAPLPRPIPLEPGTHEAVVQPPAAAAAPVTRTVQITQGQTVDWDVAAAAASPPPPGLSVVTPPPPPLTPAAPSAPPSGRPLPPAGSAPEAAAAPLALTSAPAELQEVNADSPGRRWWPWVVAAGVVVVGATAAALLITRDGPLPSGSLGAADGRRGH
jgi:hypothetical protein